MVLWLRSRQQSLSYVYFGGGQQVMPMSRQLCRIKYNRDQAELLWWRPDACIAGRPKGPKASVYAVATGGQEAQTLSLRTCVCWLQETVSGSCILEHLYIVSESRPGSAIVWLFMYHIKIALISHLTRMNQVFYYFFVILTLSTLLFLAQLC